MYIIRSGHVVTFIIEMVMSRIFMKIFREKLRFKNFVLKYIYYCKSTRNILFTKH